MHLSCIRIENEDGNTIQENESEHNITKNKSRPLGNESSISISK